ncbi:hypothetical protein METBISCDRAFT_28909, partial [Metschnikowia bicuspidata]
MKFGENLAHLSIPEWKIYILDYKDLKAAIRDLLRYCTVTMMQLSRKFSKNFEQIDLFFMAIKRASDDNRANLLARLNTLHYYVVNEVSWEVRKLTKYIAKLTKHPPYSATSEAFVAGHMQLLHANRYSFVNFDLSKITADLLYLLKAIDAELRYLLEQLRLGAHGKVLPGSNSSSSLCNAHSLATSHSGLDDLHMGAALGSADQIGKFDLICELKKNFAVHCVVPQDNSSRNDLRLTLDVHLTIPRISELCRVS